MDKFLKRHKLSKVIQETENLNIKEIHISKAFTKIPALDDLTDKSLINHFTQGCGETSVTQSPD